jgi:hypothetical protein
MSEGRFVLTRIGQTLVVTIEGAADAGCLEPAARALSDECARQRAISVVFEVSGCEVIDLDEFLGLRKLMQTVELLGLHCMVAGLKPGTAAYLASAGVSVGRLHTALNLEHALLDLNDADAEAEAHSEADADGVNDSEQVGEPRYHAGAL